jgi:hypothetical protein
VTCEGEYDAAGSKEGQEGAPYVPGAMDDPCALRPFARRADGAERMFSASGDLDAVADEESLATCLSSLDLIDVSGQLAWVSLDGERFALGRVFTDAQLARLLRRRTEVLLRWRARGLFPQPVLVDAAGRRYYADAELCDFIRILGRHQGQARLSEGCSQALRRRLHDCAFVANRCGALAWIEVHSGACAPA